MRFLPDLVRRMAHDSVTQPLSVPVASNASVYLQEVGEHKLGWRALRRELVYRLSGQERYRIDRLCQGCRRGLWMYFGVPQIGDALMDLAPRSLLTEAGLTVDLVTHPHLTDLFDGDPWFARVFSDPSTIEEAAYDFAIVPSHKHRSLKMKQRHLPRHPWLSMHGRFTGPEFHRAEFATRRLADFLNLAPTSEEFARHARQKLGRGNDKDIDVRQPPFSSRAIALALGGVDARRTYSRWPDVVSALTLAGFDEFVLLGNENGIESARQIQSHRDSSGRFHDFVGKTSLSACRTLLSHCALAIAADGGLMHLAIAVGLPLVSLFQRDVEPQWRLPPADVHLAIRSETTTVSDISPERITDMASKALLSRAARA